MALGVMLVLSISVAAVIEFSSSNARNSSLNERRQSAKALAEAGVAHGASFIAQRGPYDFSPFGPREVEIDGVPVEWSVTYAAPYWTVKATAAEQNPTGPGASDVRRTVEAKFEWRPTASPPITRKLLYVGNPGNTPLMSNTTASIATDVYARGDLLITEGKYLGESFQVWGKLTISGGERDSSIGASARSTCASDNGSFKSDFPAPCVRTEHRVADFRVRDGCAFSSSGPWTAAKCNTTSATGGPDKKIWLTSTAVTSPTTLPEDLRFTAPNVPPLSYDLGPLKPCATSTGTPPTFTASGVELMTGATYTCKSADGKGELSWDFGTKTLTAKGDIYFSGSILLKSKYHGVVGENSDGFIYVGQNLKLEPETGLCGKRSTTVPRCDPAWDPATGNNVVSFVVGQNHAEAIIQSSFYFQGGLYAAADPTASLSGGGYLAQGDSTFKGPLIIEGPVQVKNTALIDAFAPTKFAVTPPLGGPPELVLVRGSWNG